MFPGINRSFTIAFTGRSGSNALCDLLTRNGLGVPGEYFQRLPACASAAEWLSYFSNLIMSCQASGIFGAKMSCDHRAAVDERLRASLAGYQRLDHILPAHRWIRLVRQDKVLQAVSWYRAEVSQQWSTEGPPQQSGREFPYDFFHILSRFMMVQAAEAAWDAYFAQYGITPLLVVYEEFFNDVSGQLRRLIDYLGGTPDGRRTLEIQPAFVIQRDAQSFEIRGRFMRELSRIGEAALADQLAHEYINWNRFFTERRWRVGAEQTETLLSTQSSEARREASTPLSS